MIQSGGRFIGPFLKTGLPLMKNLIKPSAKSVLIPLGLSAAAWAADAGIHKKILGSGKHPSESDSCNNAILIISNDETKGIIKTVISLEDSNLLPQGVSKTIQNEAKEQIGGFLSMLLGNILPAKGIKRAGEGVIRAGYGNKKGQETTAKRQDYESRMNF